MDLPLDRQTPETLRLLIGQAIGLEVLLPMALDLLEQDIMISGDLYGGDLFANCRRVPDTYWASRPDDWVRLNGILEDFDRTVEQVNKDRHVFLDRNPYGANL